MQSLHCLSCPVFFKIHRHSLRVWLLDFFKVPSSFMHICVKILYFYAKLTMKLCSRPSFRQIKICQGLFSSWCYLFSKGLVGLSLRCLHLTTWGRIPVCELLFSPFHIDFQRSSAFSELYILHGLQGCVWISSAALQYVCKTKQLM